MTTADVAQATRAIAARGRYPTIGETFAFRDLLLEHVHRSRPRLPAELLARVRNDWGSCTDRAFYRALAWLVSRGKVVRIGGRMVSGGGYVRSVDGGAETEDELRARHCIELAAAHRCFRCEAKIAGKRKTYRRYCLPCHREMHNEARRKSYARLTAAAQEARSA